VVATKVIAVVDDEEEVRVSTRDLLRTYGARVLVFDAAEKFLAAAEAADIDGLVTDFRMPGMNGAALLDVLRQRGATFPVVVISARDSGSTQALVISKGAAAFLRKPVDPDELVMVLERLHCLAAQG
jgi:FixJ family two-component response regulator